MIEVNKQTMQNISRLLPVAVVALVMVGVAMAHSEKPTPRAALTQTTAAPIESTAPSSQATHVVVDGQEIAPTANGSTVVSSPQATTRVESSGGNTSITTTSSSENTVKTGDQNGNVSVQTNTNQNQGSSWGTTQVFSFNTSNGSGMDYSTTSVFSTGTGNVNISH